MRPLRRGIPLGRQRAVQLPDAGRVEVLLIHRHQGIGETKGQCSQHPLDQSAVIRRQFHPVKQMRAVAGVGQERLWPPTRLQIGANLARPRQGQVVFGVGGRDAGWPHRVAIHRQPAPADEIAVRRSRIAGLHVPQPIVGPRQQVRVHGVEGHVDPARPDARRGRGQLFPIIEVTGHRVRPAPLPGHRVERAQFGHLAGRKERLARLEDLTAIRLEHRRFPG